MLTQENVYQKAIQEFNSAQTCSGSSNLNDDLHAEKKKATENAKDKTMFDSEKIEMEMERWEQKENSKKKKYKEIKNQEK